MTSKILILSCLILTVACHAATLRSDKIGNFFLPDQAIQFELDLEDTPMPHSNTIAFNLLDYSNRVVASQSIKLSDASDIIVRFAPTHREGFFYLEAKDHHKQIAQCTIGVLAAASNTQPDPTSRFGTVAHLKHMSDDDRNTMLNLIKRSGIGWIREGFLWHEMEATEGNWTTERYDDLLDRSLRNGINVLPVLCFGTEWAAVSTDNIPAGKRHLAQPKTKPWQQYISTMVERYGDRVNAWEIWNEPNLPSFWQPQPNADDYANLSVEAAATIRALAPSDTIITAGFSPCQSYLPNSPDQDEQRFVHALSHKEPLPFDAIGGHPYTVFHHGVSNAETEQLFLSNRDALINGLCHNEDSPKDFPLWMTEMGVSTIPRITTERDGAGYIGVVMTLACALPNVERMILYNFRDVGVDPTEKEDMFGLLHHDYTPKPGYFAAHTVINQIGRASFQKRMEKDGIITHRFIKEDGKLVDVLWAAKEAQVYPLPENVTAVIDVTGCDVTINLAAGNSYTINVSASPVFLEH